MTGAPVIRESTADDSAAIESLYPEAFPDENLVPLVHDLLHDEATRISLVATAGELLAGHVIFTQCGIDGSDARAALLAPLAVKPGYQRQGIGSAIVNDGLQRLGNAGVSMVFVLGDPAYYSRFGFTTEEGVTPPYALPAEWAGAWQSKSVDTGRKQLAGKLVVPLQWQRRELWAP